MQTGFTVIGYDVALPALKVAAAAGIQPVNSPKAVAATSDLVIVAVGFDHEVEAVMFGDNGVLAGAGDGPCVIAIASTIAPQTMQRIAARLPESPKVALLDIPLCRGEGPAQEGKLLIMGGGDKAAFDACRPVFAAFADSIFHLGPVRRRPGRQDGQQPHPVGLHFGQRGRLQARREARRRARDAARRRCSIRAPATGRSPRGRRRSRCRGRKRT